ncbi:MAG: hypothetical protein PHE89_02785 [Alphaproteobacteria bacterium]|nr:hypothetical protein [Alphaproteobacteria bacterium]
MSTYTLESLPKEKNKFILDTNILIYLHGVYAQSDSNKKNMDIYSNIVENLIKRKAEILLDVIVLNEFINIYINHKITEYCINNLLSNDSFTNKHTKRNCPAYKEALKEIKVTIKNIESAYNIKWIKEGYDFISNVSSSNLEEKLEYMEFSDYTLSKLAEKEDAILVTNDFDLIRCPRINKLVAS